MKKGAGVVTAADISAAIERAYRAVACISWEGAHYRRDIGGKAIGR